MNETLEAMARALFSRGLWTSTPSPKQKAATPCPNPSPTSFRIPSRTRNYEIPRGWEVRNLGDIADHPRRGVQPNSEMSLTTPYIALEHMPRRCIVLSEWVRRRRIGKQQNKIQERRKSFLESCVPYFHIFGVAPVDGVCSTDIGPAILAPEEWLEKCQVTSQATPSLSTQTQLSQEPRMPRTSWSEMARYRVVVPSESVTKAFTVQACTAVDHGIAPPTDTDPRHPARHIVAEAHLRRVTRERRGTVRRERMPTNCPDWGPTVGAVREPPLRRTVNLSDY